MMDPNSNQRVELKTLEDDPYKFLGSAVTFRNTPAEYFNYLKDLLNGKLDNLTNKCFARGEHKVATYSRYILPSLRFHLSVHNIHQTHLDQLDSLARKHLKIWLGFPHTRSY